MLKLKELKNVDADTLLGALGVQRKRAGAWVAPALGGLFLGAVVGMASGLLLAPQSAEALRAALKGRLPEVRNIDIHPAEVETA
jgi:hypothetical protein